MLGYFDICGGGLVVIYIPSAQLNLVPRRSSGHCIAAFPYFSIDTPAGEHLRGFIG